MFHFLLLKGSSRFDRELLYQTNPFKNVSFTKMENMLRRRSFLVLGIHTDSSQFNTCKSIKLCMSFHPSYGALAFARTSTASFKCGETNRSITKSSSLLRFRASLQFWLKHFIAWEISKADKIGGIFASVFFLVSPNSNCGKLASHVLSETVNNHTRYQFAIFTMENRNDLFTFGFTS